MGVYAGGRLSDGRHASHFKQAFLLPNRRCGQLGYYGRNCSLICSYCLSQGPLHFRGESVCYLCSLFYSSWTHQSRPSSISHKAHEHGSCLEQPGKIGYTRQEAGLDSEPNFISQPSATAEKTDGRDRSSRSLLLLLSPSQSAAKATHASAYTASTQTSCMPEQSVSVLPQDQGRGSISNLIIHDNCAHSFQPLTSMSSLCVTLIQVIASSAARYLHMLFQVLRPPDCSIGTPPRGFEAEIRAAWSVLGTTRDG